MSEAPSDDLEMTDRTITVRLSIRKAVLAKVEGALLAEKLSLSDTGIRRKGMDPYNLAKTPPDTWGGKR